MTSPSARSPQPWQGRKILVVDDDRMNIRILQGILQREGFRIETADSGEEALEKYTSFLPDLVLLDVLLPGIDGFETCRQLHHRYGENTAPVIFITAKAESDDVVAGLSAGGVDYLPKPFRPKEAIARIRTHLQSRLLIEQQKTLVDQLSRADAAKNRFLGMAAHDLRNPLASIRGLAEFLREPSIGPLNAEQLDLVDTIHSASKSMLSLVNELLDVATIEAGELKLQRVPANLAELVSKSVRLCALDAAHKSTRLLFAERSGDPSLSLDPDKIRQVIDNLLSNAVKYSPPHSTIRVEIRRSPDGTCTFGVRDQGPGIPDHERGLLFKDFGRLSARPTGGEKSTGLGLAICRKIIDAHGGLIEAENQPGGGCEFRFTLPPTPSP